MELTDLTSKWLSIDKESAGLRNQLATLKKQQKEVTAQLWQVAKQHEIDSLATRNDGTINFISRGIRKPLSKQLLEKLLIEYHKGNIEKAKDQAAFLHHGRPVQTTEVIRRQPPEEESKKRKIEESL